MEKVYLYLVRRNNKDTKIIGVLKSEAFILPTRVDDLSLLGLPSTKLESLRHVLETHRMDWSLWLESADTYKTLKTNLLNRGIMAASSPNVPFLELELNEIPKSTLLKFGKNKTMIRRMN